MHVRNYLGVRLQSKSDRAVKPYLENGFRHTTDIFDALFMFIFIFFARFKQRDRAKPSEEIDLPSVGSWFAL
jgi:hypothetical protein